jgi:small subunit ribosomal protein S16
LVESKIKLFAYSEKKRKVYFMLAIRLQRVGRKGHAMYRMAVQESHRHPLSGRVVTYVGTYDPHTKDAKIQVEQAQKYLDNGAQPSPKVVKLLEAAGVKMPKWVVKFEGNKTKTIRNAEKLRKNRPADAEPKEAEPVEEPADKVEESVETAAAETTQSESKVDEAAAEAPAEKTETTTE